MIEMFENSNELAEHNSIQLTESKRTFDIDLFVS